MDTLADLRNIDPSFDRDTYNYSDRLRDLTRGTACLWSTGTTFRNACDLNVLYISGLLPTSPYHIGPILGESTPIRLQLEIMNRNGLITTSSEPVSEGYNVFSDEYHVVTTSSVWFFVKTKNIDTLINGITATRRAISTKRDNTLFSEEFGPSYVGEDNYTACFFIEDSTGDNELYEILATISRTFV